MKSKGLTLGTLFMIVVVAGLAFTGSMEPAMEPATPELIQWVEELLPRLVFDGYSAIRDGSWIVRIPIANESWYWEQVARQFPPGFSPSSFNELSLLLERVGFRFVEGGIEGVEIWLMRRVLPIAGDSSGGETPSDGPKSSGGGGGEGLPDSKDESAWEKLKKLWNSPPWKEKKTKSRLRDIFRGPPWALPMLAGIAIVVVVVVVAAATLRLLPAAVKR